MKTVFAIILLILSSLGIAHAQSSGTAEALNDKYGFRDARFETPIKSFKGLVLLKSQKDTKIYERPTDSKKIGGAQVSSIHYSFYKGKLLAVRIATKGYANSRALLEALVAQYGAGEQSDKQAEEYIWNTTRVYMSYDQDPTTDSAIVFMLSGYMADIQHADEAAAAKKAASDL